MTPLVSGYSPNVVNTWTLNTMLTGFLQDGVCYFLLDTKSLEMFADHTVYLAFYEGGTVPSRAQFTMGEDGSIAFREDFEAPTPCSPCPWTSAWPTRRPPRTLSTALGLTLCLDLRHKSFEKGPLQLSSGPFLCWKKKTGRFSCTFFRRLWYNPNRTSRPVRHKGGSL